MQAASSFALRPSQGPAQPSRSHTIPAAPGLPRGAPIPAAAAVPKPPRPAAMRPLSASARRRAIVPLRFHTVVAQLRHLSFEERPEAELEHRARHFLGQVPETPLGPLQARDMGLLGLAVGTALSHGGATPAHHGAFQRALLAQAPADLPVQEHGVFQFAALYGAELGAGGTMAPVPAQCDIPDALQARVQEALFDGGVPKLDRASRSHDTVIRSLEHFMRRHGRSMPRTEAAARRPAPTAPERKSSGGPASVPVRPAVPAAEQARGNPGAYATDGDITEGPAVPRRRHTL